MKYKEDSIDLLLPSMRGPVAEVLEVMRGLGFKPCLRDTLRTQAEADAFADKGTGSRMSMHLYGCAADVICDEHGWDCAAHKCDFYNRLGPVVESVGLYWGGRFDMVDQPHMQGIPPTPQAQGAMRALGTGGDTLRERDGLVRHHMGQYDPTSTAELLRDELAAHVNVELIKQFQREHELKVDGKLGPKTLARLSAALT